jgi:hypothetical protein
MSRVPEPSVSIDFPPEGASVPRTFTATGRVVPEGARVAGSVRTATDPPGAPIPGNPPEQPGPHFTMQFQNVPTGPRLLTVAIVGEAVARTHHITAT